tara:strand:+ start:59 stop:394 length:336 start_codon:yes stop_codon:yes gene_type:complete
MENLPFKVIAYLERTPDFDKEVVLMSDVVDGVSKSYIGQWNITEKPKPTDEQLEALSSKAETIKNNSVVVANRQAEYGSTETQLEFLVENGVDAFIARQNEIKNKYPKENE